MRASLDNHIESAARPRALQLQEKAVRLICHPNDGVSAVYIIGVGDRFFSDFSLTVK
jgi:hypothetical protein